MKKIGNSDFSTKPTNYYNHLIMKKNTELFDVQRPAITKHLINIFDSGELDEKVVCSILELPSQQWCD